jgi:hypothetical protein
VKAQALAVKAHNDSKHHESIDEKVARWTQLSGSDLQFSRLRDLIRFLGDELYSQYEPFIDKPPFWERIDRWVSNVRSDSDQQTLLRLIPWLLFVGKEELNTMYQAAFCGPITRWIIDSAELDIADENLSPKLEEEIRHTWFGSLAGMDIGSFMRINGVEEQSLRPDFRELSRLGDPDRLRDYLLGDAQHPGHYRRIVAVEDFVGTGRQMKSATSILRSMDKFPVLLCPMIAAHEGCEAGASLHESSPHIDFQELYRIPMSARLPQSDSEGDADPELAATSQLIRQTWDRLARPEPYDKPFGFGDAGLLVLTYLNCPNNVPPIIHRQSESSDSQPSWIPLFPRAIRET